MSVADWIRFVSLAAIWGGSFALLRVLTPVFGAVPTACMRILISGSVLTLYFLISKTPILLKQNFKHYFVMGMLNAALPFLFFAFASLHIPAGLSVILNSTAPLQTIALAAIFLKDPFTFKRFFGFAIGLGGVALIALKGTFHFDEWSGLAILAGLGAALCYSLGGIYIRKRASQVSPATLTGVSQLIGSLVLLPFAAAHWWDQPMHLQDFTPLVIVSLGILSLLCSALAFMVFYRLIARVGPARAITVGYLMPVFGIFWGVVFLDEVVTPIMLGGCFLILLGIYISSKAPKANW